jgi:hypothetical protein
MGESINVTVRQMQADMEATVKDLCTLASDDVTEILAGREAVNDALGNIKSVHVEMARDARRAGRPNPDRWVPGPRRSGRGTRRSAGPAGAARPAPAGSTRGGGPRSRAGCGNSHREWIGEVGNAHQIHGQDAVDGEGRLVPRERLGGGHPEWHATQQFRQEEWLDGVTLELMPGVIIAAEAGERGHHAGPRSTRAIHYAPNVPIRRASSSAVQTQKQLVSASIRPARGG